ncbi:MAG: hypothetical protein AB1782_03645 [Cyanobacteriota bacterium]
MVSIQTIHKKDQNIVNFGALNRKVINPEQNTIPSIKNTGLIKPGLEHLKANFLSFGKSPDKPKADTSKIEGFNHFGKETPQVALAKMVEGAISGQAKEWSFIAKPEDGSILCCKLDGKQYNLESVRTDETYEKDGVEYYKMLFNLNIKSPDGNVTTHSLTGDEYSNASDKIEKVVFPLIEKQYGLGEDLELTNVLLNLAEKTVNKEVNWVQVDANIGFGNGLSIEASGAVEGKLPDGTKVHVLEKVKNEIFSISRISFISLEKPGLPPQVIRVGSEKEEETYELFGKAFKLIEKEKELNQDLEEVNQNKGLLKRIIEDFKAGKEPEVQ